MIIEATPEMELIIRIQARRLAKRKAAERSFAEFVRQAWPILEPGTPFIDNWHIDAIAAHLEATLPWGGKPGIIRNLLVTIPPRFMKTIIISVCWTAWVWIHFPHLRFVYASYAEGLSNEHSVLTRLLVESDWYQERWGDRVQLQPGDNNKMAFSTTARGYRRATSVGGKTTGMGGDYLIVDDPHNVQRAESDAIRSAAVHWWTKAMSTRLNNPKTGVRIIIQQRVHEEDVAGVAIQSGDYVHINLPMEYEPTDYVSPIGWSDPRTQPGELLGPERFGASEVEKLKRELGSYQYAAQFQQRPVPAGGGMFKSHWWRYWQPQGAYLPPVPVKMPDGEVRHVAAGEIPRLHQDKVESWDMNFKETQSGSYVVGLVAKRWQANAFILDCYRDRIEFTAAVRAVRDVTAKHPDATSTLIEDKAIGPAVISTLRDEIPGILPVAVEGSKAARAAAATPRVEAGNWFLPHPMIAPWVEPFIHELSAFPNGNHDDQVDAFSQMDRHMFGTHMVDDLDPAIAEFVASEYVGFG